MNLLQLLLGAMLSGSSVNSVSAKTGIKSALVKKLIIAALPTLIKYLTKNASSQNGALSLLSALTQHTSKRTISEQIDEVDENDGAKIIRHILGNDEEKVVRDLSEETGLKTEEVTRGLASIAPALLSGLSAAMASQQAKPQQTAAAAPADLTGLFNMFAGQSVQQAQQANTGSDLLSALLGGAAQPQAQAAPAQNNNLLGSLMGSLLGGQQAQAQPQQTSAIDGTQLLSLLSAMMK